MTRRSLSLILVFSLVLLSFPISSQAQQPVASVNLDCEGPLDIPVFPGSTKTGSITCTVENPTAFSEKIEIEVDSGDLAHSAPGSITVAAGESEEFQVSVQANEGMLAQSLSLTVKATVVELNGAPPPNVAEDEEEEVINILQYAGVSISADLALFTVEVGDELSIEFMIKNHGNAEDTLKLSAEGPFDEDSNSADFTVSFPSNNIRIGPGQSQTVSVFLKAPNQVSSNAMPHPGSSKLMELFALELIVTSEFSCTDSTGCISSSFDSVITLQDEFVESDEDGQSDSGDSFNSLGYGGYMNVIALASVFALVAFLRPIGPRERNLE